MAQDLKGKKTRLDDGADIYQQRREVSERQKWKELDGAGKLAYFRDYYLMKLIGALAAVLLLGGIIWSSLHSNGGYDLYAAVMSGAVEQEKLAYLTGEAESRLTEAGIEKPSVLIDTNFPVSALSVQKLQVYVASGEIDVILTRDDTFTGMAGFGYFKDLRELLSAEDLKRYQGRILEVHGMGMSETEGLGEPVGGTGASAPYGIMVGETGWVASVCVSTKAPDNALIFLKLLVDETGFDAIPTAVDPTVFGNLDWESTEEGTEAG